MEFILTLLLFLIFFAPSLEDKRGSSNKGNSVKKRNGFSDRFDNLDSFDPADTFHLEDGLDHDVDCDGYCEECDDYHE